MLISKNTTLGREVELNKDLIYSACPIEVILVGHFYYSLHGFVVDCNLKSCNSSPKSCISSNFRHSTIANLLKSSTFAPVISFSVINYVVSMRHHRVSDEVSFRFIVSIDIESLFLKLVSLSSTKLGRFSK